MILFLLKSRLFDPPNERVRIEWLRIEGVKESSSVQFRIGTSFFEYPLIASDMGPVTV